MTQNKYVPWPRRSCYQRKEILTREIFFASLFSIGYCYLQLQTFRYKKGAAQLSSYVHKRHILSNLVVWYICISSCKWMLQCSCLGALLYINVSGEFSASCGVRADVQARLLESGIIFRKRRENPEFKLPYWEFNRELNAGESICWNDVGRERYWVNLAAIVAEVWLHH